MSVKILQEMVFKEPLTVERLHLLVQLREEAMEYEGFMSGEVWIDIQAPRKVLLVSKWESLEEREVWLQSEDKQLLQERLAGSLEHIGRERVFYEGLDVAKRAFSRMYQEQQEAP